MHVDLMFPNRYIKAADLADSPNGFQFTIHELKEEDLQMIDGGKEPKWVLHFEEFQKRAEAKQKVLVLNKTNAISISGLHGTETDEWKGKKVTLYATTCMAFGSRQDCVRVKTEGK